MAVVEFDKNDLEKLIGKKLSEKDYKERIPMIGCPLEGLDKNSVQYEIFPNRPDMLSIEGFARAISAFLGIKKGLNRYNAKKGKIILCVDSSVKGVRPFITSAVVRNAKISDELIASLMQVQEKLHETLGRKRKKVAIGVHDLDKVKPPFVYKGVRPESIRFVPLDMGEEMDLRGVLKRHPKGIEYGHIVSKARKWPVIIDKEDNLLSFPPIINGELTRVTQKTKNLFIDVTGTDEKAVEHALNILVTSFADRGCVIESVEIHDNKRRIRPDLSTWKMNINIDYINHLLDLDLKPNELPGLLSKMGLGFDKKISGVVIPCYRTDIMHPIDIVEDVAIAHGYGNFDPKIPDIPTIGKPLVCNDFYDSLKDLIIGLGFQEVVTLVLSNKDDEFKKMCLPEQPVAETLNPVSTECTICRCSLMPSLIDVLKQNLHHSYPQKIFEIGDVVVLDRSYETGARNEKRLCCLVSNTVVGYEEILSVFDAIMRNLGIGYKVEPVEHSSFIKGRVGKVVCKYEIGIIGEIHPQVLNNWGIEKPVIGFEISAEKLFDLVR